MTDNSDLDSELTRYFEVAAQSVSSSDEQSIVDDVGARIDRATRHRWFVGMGIVGAGLAVTALGVAWQPWNAEPTPQGGTASRELTGNATAEAGGDCLSGFVYDGKVYLLALGSHLQEPVVGAASGSGETQTCEDSGGRSGEGPRRVFEMAEVPTSQAIIVMGAGEPSVLLASVKPDKGWDPDLSAWMDASGVHSR